MQSKIQTDNLQRIEVMTGDNVLMHIQATVCWSITDVQRCVERAAETMAHGGEARNGKAMDAGTIDQLRNDVLRQAEASLSALVGKVNFSSTFSAAAAVQVGQIPLVAAMATDSVTPDGVQLSTAVHEDVNSLLFDIDKLKCSVAHANDMTSRYGVQVLSINIISAKPADDELMQCLAKGAVAAAEAQQLETIARGRAKAVSYTHLTLPTKRIV